MKEEAKLHSFGRQKKKQLNIFPACEFRRQMALSGCKRKNALIKREMNTFFFKLYLEKSREKKMMHSPKLPLSPPPPPPPPFPVAKWATGVGCKMEAQ